MIILVFGQRGGAMKSICSQNLAVELAHREKSVCLVDADPGGTTTNFGSYREEEGVEPAIFCVQKKGKITKTIQELDTKYDFVIVDVQGNIDRTRTQEMRSGLVAAHIALAPFRPTQDHRDSILDVQDLIDEAKDFNTGLKTFCMISLAPTHTAREQDILFTKQVLKEHSTMNVLDTVAYNRVVYSDAYAVGRGVREMNDIKAKAEMDSLVTELLEKANG
ncbi:cobyrinic acid ac-diamide synthase [Xenorhabdus sp. PB30.3]|uniref:AAA family ATPase n=1 Tax=Xenorhabdus sp. PB30.3 TaxID=2788941 RepID=UPI001E530721|nr:cobyrinic acid ac-diamide synthase [Xenorhabdus sp. PB30.3]MCC8380468.1 AAA family ATPase [Xenorhabdus sp. PB30.3]